MCFERAVLFCRKGENLRTKCTKTVWRPDLLEELTYRPLAGLSGGVGPQGLGRKGERGKGRKREREGREEGFYPIFI